MVGGGGESRALADCDTRRNTGHPQHPKPMRMKKGNHGFRGRESNRQTGTEYIPTRLDNSNADLGTERMEPVPRRRAEQQQKQAESRAKESEREVRRAEGRRSRDPRRRKGKVEKEGNG